MVLNPGHKPRGVSPGSYQFQIPEEKLEGKDILQISSALGYGLRPEKLPKMSRLRVPATDQFTDEVRH
jgi:hypothetical protein